MSSKLQQAVQIIRNSGDPEKRRKAIRYLAKSGEPDAMKALAWSSKNDPDAELRELARKGGAHLKRELQAAEASPAESKVDEMFTFDDDEPDDASMYEQAYADDTGFGDADYSRTGPIEYDARSQINTAMDLFIDGEHADALRALAKALDIDPRTQQDNAAQNIASEITGMHGEDALRALASPTKRTGLIANAVGSDKQATSDETTWGTTWMDIGIFALVYTVGNVIFSVLGLNRFLPLLREVQTLPEYQQYLEETGEIDSIAFILQSVGDSSGIGAVLLNSLPNAIGAILGLIIAGFIYHFVIVTVFDGQRPSAVTLDRTANVYSVFTGASFLILTVAVFMLPNELSAYMNEAELERMLPMLIGMGALGAIIGFGQYIVLGVVLGRAQKVGVLNGCLTIIIPFAAMFGLSCGCSLLLGLAAG